MGRDEEGGGKIAWLRSWLSFLSSCLNDRYCIESFFFFSFFVFFF